MAKRNRPCENCKALVPFIYFIEREGYKTRVCQDCLRSGDKVFHGYGKNDFTIYTYQTGNR